VARCFNGGAAWNLSTDKRKGRYVTTITATSPLVEQALKLRERANWGLETFDNRLPEATDSVFTRRTIGVGTRQPEATDHLARKVVYSIPTDLEARLKEAALHGTKVTVLRSGETFLGAPVADIRQGTLFFGARGLGLLPTGKRSNGILLGTALDLIESAKPGDVTELATRWIEGTGLPLTELVTREKLALASANNPLAVLWTHPGFDGERVPGCVWVIDEVRDDIANGYLWVPESSLVSEHGSIEVKHLIDTGALVSSAPRIGFGDCFNLPTSTREAYRDLFGL